MKYQPPWNTQFNRPVDDPNAPYINANPSAGIEGSVPPAGSIEYPQREIVNASQLAGFDPSDDDLQQLTRGIRQGTAYATATVIGGGDPNALYLNLNPKLDAYRPGLCLRVKIPVENTGPVGINIDNLGMKTITRANGALMAAQDLRANMVADIVYDGNVFQLVNFQGFTSTTTNNNKFVINVPYCADLGSANHIIAPFSPPFNTSDNPVVAGTFVFVKIAANCTGPTFISVNGLPEKQLLRTDLLSLAPRDVIAGMVCGMVYDGASWQMVSMPASIARDLIAPMTYYVRKTGNDNNDGLTPSTPFLTIQRAINMMNTWNNRGYQFTIDVGDGTYEERIDAPVINGSGSCYLKGNTASPQNCVIWDNVGSSGSTACLRCSGSLYTISGFKFISNAGNGITAFAGAIVSVSNVEMGNCGRSHFETGASAEMNFPLSPAFIRVSGSAQWHRACIGGTMRNLTIGGTPSIGLDIVAGISVSIWNYCSARGYSAEIYSNITNKGLVSSGYKYVAEKNSVVDTNGQPVDYLPGTLAGYTATGGQYT
jgi:hypothetical protein